MYFQVGQGDSQHARMAHKARIRRRLALLLLLSLAGVSGRAQSPEVHSWFTPTASAQPNVAVVLLAVTVTLTSSPVAPTAGQAVTLTATVAPVATPGATVEQNPTGDVVFYSGTTVVGTAPLVASAGNASVATLTLPTLPAGVDQISAVYMGDLTFQTTTSNVIVLTLQGFSIVASSTNPPTNLTIERGGAGTASYIVSGLGGFASQVQVVCAVPSQDDMTCAATPQDVTPTTTVIFTVQTFSTGLTPPATTADRRPLLPGGLARTVSGTALALLGILLLPFGRRVRVFVRLAAGEKTRKFVVLLLLLIGLGGVGLGCSSNTVATGAGTPLGVATLTITASANVDNAVVSHSVYLTVNVVPNQ